MHSIKVGNREIGAGKPCYIIAEAGSNHNGSIEQAKRLIDVAVDCKADAVKFQVFRAEMMYPKKKIKVKYLRDMGIKDSLYDIIKKYEVPYNWIMDLSDYSRKAGIEFLATPFELESVKVLNRFVKAFKIASYESMHLDLINTVKKTGKPLFISTGGSREKEIDALVEKVLSDYKDKTVLLHCIAKYPAPIDETGLNAIPYMREKYRLNIGYSDHTKDPVTAAVIAVSLGSVVIEKHFTLDKRLPGPDHAFAMEPHELKSMVNAVRRTESALRFSGRRDLQKCERELYFYKRCLYCKEDLSKGHLISKKDLKVLRNIGLKCDYINPVEMNSVLGRRLKRGKKRDELLTRKDLE